MHAESANHRGLRVSASRPKENPGEPGIPHLSGLVLVVVVKRVYGVIVHIVARVWIET